MSDNDQLIILVAVADSHTAGQIISQLRQNFSQLPLRYEHASDGKKALSEYTQLQPALAIIGAELPTLSGYALFREIRKISGATGVLFLHEKTQRAPDGAESILLPIAEWTSFFAKFQGHLPDDFKAKFDLFERNSLLYQKLVEFGTKYRGEKPTSTILKNEPLALLPKVFEGDTRWMPPSSLEKSLNTTTTIYRNFSPQMAKKYFWLEFAMLVLIWTICAGVYLITELSVDFGSKVGILKIPLLILASVATLGFFTGNQLQKYFATLATEEKN